VFGFWWWGCGRSKGFVGDAHPTSYQLVAGEGREIGINERETLAGKLPVPHMKFYSSPVPPAHTSTNI